MKLNFTSETQKEDFFKSRVEDLKLEKSVLASLLGENIRTIGGVVQRSELELKRILGKDAELLSSINEKIEAYAAQAKEVAEETRLNIPESYDELSLASPRLSPLLDINEEDDIVDTLSHYFGLDKSIVVSHTRRQDVVKVRDLIVYLLREYGDMSYPGIGRLLDRDHTTIIHAYKKVLKNVQARPEMEIGLSDMIGKVKEIKERKLRIEEELIPEIFGPEPNTQEALGGARVFKEIPERNLRVLELYREGLTLANIGSVIGVSRERVRQVVAKTIRQLAINESIEKGIVMDSGVLVEEESKKRKMMQESKREAAHPKRKPQEQRWSKYYLACRSCGTTAIPHVRKGLCEKCVGHFRAERREDIVKEHNDRCDSCGKKRSEVKMLYGRDFYITKDKQVLCKECFSQHSGKILGSYKHHEWSRHYERCIKCGTTTVPHFKKGLCEDCSDTFSNEKRERIIADNAGKCVRCGISRNDAKNKYKKDLFAVRTGEALCRVCFQKYAKSGMRNSKANKKETER